MGGSPTRGRNGPLMGDTQGMIGSSNAPAPLATVEPEAGSEGIGFFDRLRNKRAGHVDVDQGPKADLWSKLMANRGRGRGEHGSRPRPMNMDRDAVRDRGMRNRMGMPRRPAEGGK